MSYVVRDPLDLIAIVPLVLGFHPTESVTLLTFRGAGQSFHARVDLPDDDAARREVRDTLLAAVSANAVERAAVVVHTGDHGRALAAVEALVPGLAATGAEVIGAFRAHDRLWFPLLGDRTTAPVGTPYDLEVHRFTAQAVLDGRAVQPSRESLRALLVGHDEDERARVALAAAWHTRVLDAASVAHLRGEARWLREAVADAVGTGERLDPAAVARVVALVAHHQFRDIAWVDLRRADAPAHVELWLDVTRRSPEAHLAGPSALLALAAYSAGDGALAWCAVDRCREVSPHHSLVRLVDDLLSAAVPPRLLEPMDAALLPLLCG